MSVSPRTAEIEPLVPELPPEEPGRARTPRGAKEFLDEEFDAPLVPDCR